MCHYAWLEDGSVSRGTRFTALASPVSVLRLLTAAPKPPGPALSVSLLIRLSLLHPALPPLLFLFLSLVLVFVASFLTLIYLWDTSFLGTSQGAITSPCYMKIHKQCMVLLIVLLS